MKPKMSSRVFTGSSSSSSMNITCIGVVDSIYSADDGFSSRKGTSVTLSSKQRAETLLYTSRALLIREIGRSTPLRTRHRETSASIRFQTKRGSGRWRFTDYAHHTLMFSRPKRVNHRSS